MKYFRLPPDPLLPVGEVSGESEDGDEEERGESHCQRYGVYPCPGVGGYAGAGLQVVEHEVVGAGGVGQVGTGAETVGPVPGPAPGQAGVPLVVVGTHTTTLEREELLVTGTALPAQLTATPALCVLLHLHLPTESLPHTGLRAGLGHEGRDGDGVGLEWKAGVVVVTTGADTPPHLQVTGGQQGELRPGVDLHYHLAGGAGVATVCP